LEENSYAEWLQVRTSGDPAKMTGEVRAALAEIDPEPCRCSGFKASAI